MKRFCTLALVLLALAGCGSGLPDPFPTPTPAPTVPPAIWHRAPTSFLAQSHQWPYVFARGAWHVGAVDTAEIDAINAAGFTGVRLSLIPWEMAVDANGDWDFTGLDQLYAALLARGLTPLFMLNPPQTDAQYDEITAFCASAADRYPYAALELGNEPNEGTKYWPENLTPAMYWAHVKPWAEAWRAAQPKASISTAGTSGMDLAFQSDPGWQAPLIAAIENDPEGNAFASGLINAIAVHPYSEHPEGGSGRGDLYTDLLTLKAMLPANVDIWLTEYGDNPPTVLSTTSWLEAAASIDVPVMTWFEIRDVPGSSGFGLLNADLSRKSPDAYAAAQAVLAPSPSPSP